MTAIFPFEFEGKAVRVVEINGEPLFVGKDVAERLGYADPTNALKQHCRGVVKRHPILDSLGRTQEVRVLTEPDVLRLIVGSKLAAAQRFERWVFEEVLPAVRKNGGYIVAKPDETQEELVLRAISVLQATVARQKTQLSEALPKAVAHDRIAQAQGSLNITETAKALQIGPKVLFTWLQRNGWIYRRVGSSRWVGYQKRVNAGDLEHKVTVIPQESGTDKVTEQVRITPQGLAKLAKVVPQGAA